jgi:hypothetical protein
MKKFTSTLTFTFQVEVTGEAMSALEFLNQIKQIQMQGGLIHSLESDFSGQCNYQPIVEGKIQTIKIADQ